MKSTLHSDLSSTSRRAPASTALVEGNGGAISFGALDLLARRVANALWELGMQPGDRVGIHLPKSIDTVAVICGVLRAGGVYVPVDVLSPASRAAFALADCGASVVFTAEGVGEYLRHELALTGSRALLQLLPGVGEGRGVYAWLERFRGRCWSDDDRLITSAEPACILYTSGSTGKPKGVVISHRAARAFIDWAAETLRPSADDTFASFAPFHFDLSLFDLFVAQRTGARVVLIDEATSRNPRQLVGEIEARHMTIWYSTPTALMTLLEHGRLECHDCKSLRLVLFAGEVFPVPRLRRLMRAWPKARYFNLYGPTETNVCTWYEVPEALASDEGARLPIGRACSHARTMVWSEDGPAEPGEIGELLVSGAGLMSGYWHLPDADALAFHTDEDGVRWYRTGDLVSEGTGGDLMFHGRRDRMVKKRGYRIELAEIEGVLSGHPSLALVAVRARSDGQGEVRIEAFLTSTSPARPSVIELKGFCAMQLPSYMIPDSFTYLDSLPETSTGKIDYQALASRIQSP